MPKLVRVEWADALAEHGWRKVEDISGPSPIVTVGFLAREDDTAVVVCASATEDGEWNNCMVVPRGMITKITELLGA